MKIRFDFVTNSSSTSFGIAAVEVVKVVVASALVAQLAYAAGEAVRQAAGGQGGTAGADADAGPAGPAESTKTSGSGETAGDIMFLQEMFRISAGDPLDLLHKKESAMNRQLESYRKQYGDLSKNGDPNDPALQKQLAENEAYIGYLHKKLDEVGGAKFQNMLDTIKSSADESAQKELFAKRSFENTEADRERGFLQVKIAKAEGAGEDASDLKELLRQIDARDESAEQAGIRRDSAGDEISWDYISDKTGINTEGATAPLGADDGVRTFHSTITKSMKGVYSGAKKSPIGAESMTDVTDMIGQAGDGRLSPEIIGAMQRGIANFLRKKVGGKYGTLSGNLFKIGDLTAQRALDSLGAEDGNGWDALESAGQATLKSSLDLIRGDITGNGFSSLKGLKDAKNGVFNWRAMLKYIRDRKPLERAVKKDFRNKEKRK